MSTTSSTTVQCRATRNQRPDMPLYRPGMFKKSQNIQSEVAKETPKPSVIEDDFDKMCANMQAFMKLNWSEEMEKEEELKAVEEKQEVPKTTGRKRKFSSDSGFSSGGSLAEEEMSMPMPKRVSVFSRLTFQKTQEKPKKENANDTVKLPTTGRLAGRVSFAKK